MANIIKELISKASEVTGRMGFGMKHEENLKKDRGIKGEFFITLNHRDGKVEKHYRNIIVDSASYL